MHSVDAFLLSVSLAGFLGLVLALACIAGGKQRGALREQEELPQQADDEIVDAGGRRGVVKRNVGGRQAKKDAYKEAKRKAKEEIRKLKELQQPKQKNTKKKEGVLDSGRSDKIERKPLALDELKAAVEAQKLVCCEEMAANFHTTATVIIGSIRDLEKSGRLLGVFINENSYFLNVTEDEAAAVAEQIKKHGRMNLSSFSDMCQEMISITPKTAH
jgi:hypothetical protein